MSLGNYKAQSEFYDESEDVDDDDGFRGDSIDSMSRWKSSCGAAILYNSVVANY